MVLLWHLEYQSGPPLCQKTGSTTTWLFNPLAPAQLIKIGQQVPVELFCSGMAWDRHGNLLVAGGNASSSTPAPTQTYSFQPHLLGVVDDSLTIPVTGTPPWGFLALMAISRYYPTLVNLNRNPVYGSESPFPVGTPFPLLMDGSSSVIFGGPPKITCEGNEFWEVIPAPENQAGYVWYPAMIPEDPTSFQNPSIPSTLCPLTADVNSPHHGTLQGAAYDVYSRPAPTYTERLLDTYPRAFQVSHEGQIFITGDTDTGANPANPPGASWVMKLRYSTLSGQTEWELWPGPSTGDRYYDSAAFIFQYDATSGVWDERVFSFGGSFKDVSGWSVHDKLLEFVRGSPEPFVDGIWQVKTIDPLLERVWLNAVVLPTGQVFIEGGSSEDAAEHSPVGTPAVPVYTPIIYDVGANAGDPGTIHPMAQQSVPVMRLYHQLAVLLPDGRVLVAGGSKKPVLPPANPQAPDPQFSGEMFSPPYMFHGYRPTSDSVPSSVAFGSSFTMTANRQAVNSIAKVVLMRPTALTHHSEHNQRYIELVFSVQSTYPNGSLASDTLSVTAPPDTLGPEGYYMLFVVEDVAGANPPHLDLVPSVASFIRLQ